MVFRHLLTSSGAGIAVQRAVSDGWRPRRRVARPAGSGPGRRSRTPRHLKKLHEAGLVTAERRGAWTYYRAVPDALSAIADVAHRANEAEQAWFRNNPAA